jgi:hypothetical protein
MAVLIHVAEYVIEAAFAQNILGLPARNSLGGRTPVNDFSIGVHRVYSVIQRIQERSRIQGIVVDFVHQL